MQQIVFLLQNLLVAWHVSGTIMPIIRSSIVIQMAAAFGTWFFGLQIVGLVWGFGLCVRFAVCCSSSSPQTGHITHRSDSNEDTGNSLRVLKRKENWPDRCFIHSSYPKKNSYGITRAIVKQESYTSTFRSLQLTVSNNHFLQHPANRTHNPQLHTRPTTCKPKNQIPQAAAICITLELLMMGIMVLETCWANSKFCNKNHLLHLVGLFISTY